MRDFEDHQASGGPAGNVVQITPETVPTRQISVLSQLEAYWRTIALPGQIPYRHDVEPKAIGPCLSHVYLATVVAPGLARIRFAGQELSNIFGMDPRGMPMSALYDLTGRRRLSQEIERICETPTIVELPIQTNQGFMRRPMLGRMSMLPLKDEMGQVSRFMGAIVFDGRLTPRGSTQISVETNKPFRIEPIPEARRQPIPARPGRRQDDAAPQSHLSLVIDNT